jgi:hypothetical protein
MGTFVPDMRNPREAIDEIAGLWHHDAMACSLLSSFTMTVISIVKLADGEEMISVVPRERSGASSVMEDPRRGSLERRGAVKMEISRKDQTRVRRETIPS